MNLGEMRNRSEEFQVAAAEAGERLDRVLAARVAELSRSRLKALILDGGSRSAAARSAIPATASTPATRSRWNCRRRRTPSRSRRRSRSISCYEDDAIIVIDKPRGLVVHPAAGNWTGTLVNALIAHCGDSLSGIGGVQRPGIVHRLDKDTTGLMVVAKTDRAHRTLAAQFADHGRTGPLRARLPRLRLGRARPAQGHHRQADRPPSQARDKMAVREGGREAITHWEVLERYPGTDGKPVASLHRLPAGDRPHPPDPGPSGADRPSAAGRRHLRPRLQDKVQHLGPEARAALDGLGRQALHAYLLRIEHPDGGDEVEFRSELPADLLVYVKA